MPSRDSEEKSGNLERIRVNQQRQDRKHGIMHADKGRKSRKTELTAHPMYMPGE